MVQYKVIGICGEAGSGKDSLAAALVDQLNDENMKAHMVVSYTTRPKRAGEIEGYNYHYVSNAQMTDLILQNRMLECAVFNDWVYGTCIDGLEENAINIAVLNPEGIANLSIDNRIDLCIIRCVCDEKRRLIRQLEREPDPDIDEILRRLKADRNDFADFRIADYSRWNMVLPTIGDITVSEEAEFCLHYIKLWTEKDNQ